MNKFVLGVLVALAITLLSDDAGAIPVFAGKYQTACTTCYFGPGESLGQTALGKSFLQGFTPWLQEVLFIP